jgi:hypothetical protein
MNSSRLSRENQPKPRWYQWRLRSLLILGVLAAIAITYVVTGVLECREENTAALAIRKGGGMSGCGTWWLGRLLRDDSLVSVGSVALSGKSVSETTLGLLKRLRHLQTLLLTGDKVTDRDLVYVEELTGLRRLWLEGASVTDAGLVHLRTLSELEFLFLDDTEVTDAGLAQLQPLKQLIWLDVSNTKVTDEGVETLHKALPRCMIYRGH